MRPDAGNAPVLAHLDVPVVWALAASDAADECWRTSGIDRFLRWRDDLHAPPAWHRWLGAGRAHVGAPVGEYTEMTGRLLSFHPDGMALVMESVGSTLVVIPVDALRVVRP